MGEVFWACGLLAVEAAVLHAAAAQAEAAAERPGLHGPVWSWFLPAFALVFPLFSEFLPLFFQFFPWFKLAGGGRLELAPVEEPGV